MISGKELMCTGIPGLDHLLGGGLVRGNSLLIEGPPGSGKTTVALRTLYEGAMQFDEPGLILTFEEFPRQIYEEAAGFGMDLAALEQRGKLRIVWTPPERILQGFAGKSDLIENIVKELGVRRLVIDSITHFKRVAHSETELRETLAEILNFLKLRGINALLVKELERMDDATIAFEEYLVDASLRVYNARAGQGGDNERFLEIRKTRGQSHVSGLHPFELGEDGLVVYPRLRPEDVRRGAERPANRRRRMPVGVAGLDAMLAGGFWEGSFNLAAGYQGTGKTVLAYHFVDEGLRRGEACRSVVFNRRPEDLLREAASLGFNWDPALADGRLRVDTFTRGGMSMEKLLGALDAALHADPPQRFVLESLDDLFALPGRDRRVADGVQVLRALLADVGATALCLHRAQGLAGDLMDSAREIGEFTDGILQFSLAENEGRLCRFLSVRKHAGSDHAKELRELVIGARGMVVAESAGHHRGILTGQMQIAPAEAAPEVLPRIKAVRDAFQELLAASGLPEDLRRRLLAARRELVLADVVLQEHFGHTRFTELAGRRSEEAAPEPVGGPR
jgi:circadian clock protein KaiC